MYKVFMSLQLPSIHLNGSGRENLKAQYRKAIETLCEGITNLPSPHGRDYYPQGDQALVKANDEFLARIERINAVINELKVIYDHVRG